MKRLITAILLVFVIINASAQKRQTTAIGRPNRDGLLTKGQEGIIYSTVEDEFVRSTWFGTVTRLPDDFHHIMGEFQQLGDDAFDQETLARLGELSGADYICVINAVILDSNRINLSLKLLSVATGKIIRSRQRIIDISRSDIFEKGIRELAIQLAKDVSESRVNFGSTGGTKLVDCYGAFTIIDSEIWCSAIPTPNETGIEIKVYQNPTFETRTCTITTKFGDTKETLTREVPIIVSQEGTVELVDKKRVEFDPRGGEERIRILVDNEFRLPPDIPPWLSVEPSPEGYFISIKAPNILENQKRSYTLNLRFIGKNENKPCPITISQTEGPLFNENTLHFDASGGKKSIQVYTSDPKNIKIKSKIDGVTVEQKDDMLTFSLSKNKTEEAKIIKVPVRIGNRDGVITIHQEQGNKSDSPFRLINPYRSVGITFANAQRYWNIFPDKNEEFSSWEKPEAMSGVQVGLKFNHFFAPEKHGIGIGWGLYYEYVSANKTAINHEAKNYDYSFQKHIAYIPVHLMYKFDFSKHFGIFLYGGAGADLGISESIKVIYTDESLPFYESQEKINFSSIMDRLNVSVEYGCGIQVMRLQIGASIANRVFTPEKTTFTDKQKKATMVNISFMF